MRDACRAVTRCKKANRELAKAKAQGKRLDEPYAEVGFRSRKHPKQGCYIPRRAATKRGAYFTILGNLRMAEQLPDGHQDCRLTLHNGQYHLAVAFNAGRRKSETQARVVALDPGIRTFLTWFSETDAGQIGKHDFGRIQRLCHHLDQLISRTAKAGSRKRRNMRKAADRMRVRITNLINELHHQAARFLVDNFDLILLPTFETSDMVQRGKRKIRSKSVRSMLTFAHYRFQQFLTVEGRGDGQTGAAGQRSIYQQNLQLERGDSRQARRATLDSELRRLPRRTRHQRRPWDIPAGFGRYPLADAISVHRNRRC